MSCVRRLLLVLTVCVAAAGCSSTAEPTAAPQQDAPTDEGAQVNETVDSPSSSETDAAPANDTSSDLAGHGAECVASGSLWCLYGDGSEIVGIGDFTSLAVAPDGRLITTGDDVMVWRTDGLALEALTRPDVIGKAGFLASGHLVAMTFTSQSPFQVTVANGVGQPPVVVATQVEIDRRNADHWLHDLGGGNFVLTYKSGAELWNVDDLNTPVASLTEQQLLDAGTKVMWDTAATADALWFEGSANIYRWDFTTGELALALESRRVDGLHSAGSNLAIIEEATLKIAAYNNLEAPLIEVELPRSIIYVREFADGQLGITTADNVLRVIDSATGTELNSYQLLGEDRGALADFRELPDGRIAIAPFKAPTRDDGREVPLYILDR